MKSIVLAMTVLAVFAWGQTAAPPQPPITDLQNYLSLTDSQVQSLQTIQSQLRSSTASLRQQIAQKRQTLETDLAGGSSSAATLGQLLLDIQALEKQITTAQTNVQTQTAAVLNAAQKVKLQTLIDASNLQPQIRQAEMAGLIAPPQGAGMPGMRPMGGRGMMGAGMGPMGRMGGPMAAPRARR